MLPVISRTQLGMSSKDPLPSVSALEHCPLHLLGAIYALALRFVQNDEHLAVWQSQTSPSADVIWRFVYEQLQEEIYLPRLSVLQAALLYLHKEPADEQRYALSDTPFTWSWVGTIVGLATSLSLQTESSMFAIPSWEKRLRKRLWWAVLTEDKWRALLLGRPPYIHRQEWDVEELEPAHFASSSVYGQDSDHVPFIFFSRLTVIAESVQGTLYSLRASQMLCTDMDASVAAARPLLEELNAWRASLPDFRRTSQSNSWNANAGAQSSLQFSYYLLVIYVYRALLRPMVQSNIPPHIIDLEEPIVVDTTLNFDDFNWEVPALANVTPLPTLDTSAETHAEMAEDIVRAANECAAGMINLTRRLSFSDLSSFWHSCKSIISTISMKQPLSHDMNRVPCRLCIDFELPRLAHCAGAECTMGSQVETVARYLAPDAQ